MTQTEFNRTLLQMKERAEEIASAIPSASEEELLPLLREFVRCKYILEPDEMTTDDLMALGKKSTAKLIGAKNAGLQFPDKAAGCTSASSEAIKKVLLAMALGKILGVRLSPDDVAEADTIAQLAELIGRLRGGKD